MVPLNETSCILTWIDTGSKYKVQKCVIGDYNSLSEVWKDVANDHTTSTLVVKDLVFGTKYKFRVCALNELGLEQYTTIEYEHIR